MSLTRRPILLFTNSLLMRGMEEHLLQLGEGLVDRGYTVAAVVSPRQELHLLRDGLRRLGVQVHAPGDRQRSPGGAARRLGGLVETIRRYPGCILHLHFSLHCTGELVTLAGRLGGARAIIRTEHNPPEPPPRPIDQLRTSLRDRLLSKVIYVSEQNRSDYLRLLHRDARQGIVVPNGVDVDRFSPDVQADTLRAELGLPADAPIVGTVSSLAETRKGIAYFLDMAAAVSRVRDDVRYLIVGDGLLRAELEQRARALGIGEKVIFTGQRQDVPRVLAAMQVFVQASLYEGCQYALLEAMAAGRAVVTTPAGIAADIVRDGENALLVPLADSQALATGVLRVLDDAPLADKLRLRARESIVEGYSLQAMIANITRVYDAVQ